MKRRLLRHVSGPAFSTETNGSTTENSTVSPVEIGFKFLAAARPDPLLRQH
jgi:hypothetical protein